MMLWMVLACSVPEPSPAEPVKTGACKRVEGEPIAASYSGPDLARTQRATTLVPVASGCGSVTDIQWVPGRNVMMVVAQEGALHWVDLDAGSSGTLAVVNVKSGGERGLLGLAFHPKFADNGLFYLYRSMGSPHRSWVVEYHLAGGDLSASPVEKRTVLDVQQPYGNHNAGQLQFGPDGMLYVGLGDGGAANDPHRNGQDPSTLLGSMLRIDVDHPREGRPYGIPADNPRKDGWKPELFAIGLRNPWRFSFDPTGRLVVADVGQNRWEEVTIVASGSNHGWNKREAQHCFPPRRPCSSEGLVDPVYEYGREDGVSITGGYVHTAERPGLTGRYLFGDYGTGRIWAISLPADGITLVEATALGKFPVNISTFGRDHQGRIYVGGHADGRVYRLD